MHLGLSRNFDDLPSAVCCRIPMFANVFVSNKIIRASFIQLIPINPSLLLHLKLSLQFTTKSNCIKLSLLPPFLALWVLMRYIASSRSGKILLAVGMLELERSVSRCKTPMYRYWGFSMGKGSRTWFVISKWSIQ